MLPDILGLGLSLILSACHALAALPTGAAWPLKIVSSAAEAISGPPVFRPVDRAVSNWRREAAFNLALPPRALLQIALNKRADGVTRCVKLNNYWCIKKAGWNGEIASDVEGHVAFASALEGATVAAMLLRRYYVDYSRHSALAIVSRWAPAQCGVTTAFHARGGNIARSADTLALRDVAPRGIQNTLRARWLAGHGRGMAAKLGRVVALRRSVVPDHLLRMMPAPEIAVGMGERAVSLKPFAFNLLSLGKPILPPLTSCAADTPRIEAYAQHAAAGVVPDINGDLHLFEEDGAATPNLARVMGNMAAVEIGPLSARGSLIDAAIAAAARRAGPAEKPGAAAVPARQP